MVLRVLQQGPADGKKNWNQGTLIERQNLITLEKYVMKKDYKSSILRLTVTKKELCTYGVNDENNCPYCKEPDSILHTFVEWHYTQTFYVKVVDWFTVWLL